MASSRFSVGSRVRIERREPECPQSWSEHMDVYVGREAEVTEVMLGWAPYGYRLSVDDGKWNWPEGALTFADVAPEIPVLKVGDRVLITKRVEDEPGWSNIWVKSMGDYIGRAAKIRAFSGHAGIILDVDGGDHGWPASALTLMSEPLKPEVLPLPQLPNQGVW